MQEQGGKPSGLFGRILGKSMNLCHGNIYKWGLQKCSIRETDSCLDIGCGGGAVVRAIAEIAIRGRIYGLDHSPEMVDLSRRRNRGFIDKGFVKIDQGSVTSLPYSNNQFDLVTAFETIQFWPDLEKDIREIERVLKTTGTFMIANRYPPEHSTWTEGLQIKNSKQYVELLNSAGFSQITLDDETKKGWICILASVKTA